MAKVAVAILLLYPWLYWHVKNPMNVITQMLGIVLVLDLIASELWPHETPIRPMGVFAHPFVRPICIGLALAMVSLVHGAVFPAMTVIWLLLFSAGIVCRNRRLALVAVVSGLTAMIAIAPWTYRNWKVTHRFIPVVHSAGACLFLGE